MRVSIVIVILRELVCEYVFLAAWRLLRWRLTECLVLLFVGALDGCRARLLRLYRGLGKGRRIEL